MIGRFQYLKVGLGLMLAFVGVKMLIAGAFRIPIAVSLGIACALLALSVLASLAFPAKRNRAKSSP
jgi:tellurite resistance protein TerC